MGQQPAQDQRDQDRAQQRQPQQDQRDQAQRGQTDSNVRLSVEQRTKIRQTVLSRSDVPRVDRVNFSISVGTVVPSHVRIVEVPPALIEIHPQWRGYSYFVVQEEIVIVDRDHRIVATVPTSGSSAQIDSGQGSVSVSQGGQGSVSFSQEEIRRVQMVLKEKGFEIEVDGLLGPRTKEALMTFQRREGIQVSGQIDVRTMTALGLSEMGDRQGREGGRQPSTAGQGDSMQQSPGDQDRRSGQQGSAREEGSQRSKPSTTGQSGDSMKQPSANEGAGAGRSDMDNDTAGQPARQSPQTGNEGRAPRQGGEMK
jgi:peptidoglycan hydrolase-like protein with peptidoglycan-binding domain